MIKLENQFRLTINGKVIETDNPKQALWSNIFNTTGEKYEPEFLDKFLEEVRYELELIQTLKDKSPEEAFFQFLGGSPESKSFMAWVFMVNCGLSVRKDNKLLLSENGEDLLEVLSQLGIENSKPGNGDTGNDPGTGDTGNNGDSGNTGGGNDGSLGEGEVTPDWGD